VRNVARSVAVAVEQLRSGALHKADEDIKPARPK
jgi:hypothetical protein